MSLNDLRSKMEGVETKEEKDSVGGGFLRDSGIIDSVIETAFSYVTKGGSTCFTIIFKDSDGQKLTDTQYVTSGREKGALPYYLDKDKNKIPLPGFTHVDNFSLLLTGKSFLDLEPQDAVVKIYDGEQQKEVPTEVSAYPELKGLPVKIGMLKVIVNDSSKQGNKWVKNNNKREENQFAKFFLGETGQTSTESKAGTEATFIETWKESFEGKVVDRFKEVKGAPQSGTGFKAGGADAGGEQKKSLFPKKDD